MRKYWTIGSAVLVAVGLMAVTSTAKADEVSGVSIKLEPGLALPLTNPQTARFQNAGFSGTVKGLVGVTPWLDLGPTFSVTTFHSDVTGTAAPTAWAAGGTARIKRPHDRSNQGRGFGAISPWADADIHYVRTGQLDRPGMSASIGAQVPMSDSREVWVGPFARYQSVFSSDKPGVDTSSAKILIAGLTVEFGPTVKAKVDGDLDGDGVPDSQDRCPYVPGPKDNQGCPLEAKPEVKKEEPKKEEPKKEEVPVVAEEKKFELNQRVQFAWDSASLEEVSIPLLEQVVKALTENSNYHVKVEGHASSEGQVEHNNKLSERRAQSVVRFLVKHGIAADRISAEGFGSSRPVADNETEVGRVANRRVEFVVNIVVVEKEGSVK